MKFVSTSAVLLFLGLVSATGQTPQTIDGKSDTVTVGGVEVIIPLPEGFVRIDGLNSAYDEIQSGFTPATNRVLLMAGSEEDHTAIKAGEAADLSRNFNIQVLRKLERKNFSKSDFSKLKKAMRQEMGDLDLSREIEKMTDQGSKKLSDAIGEKTEVSIDLTSPVGILSEDENSLSFGMEMDLGVSAAGESEQLKGYVNGCFLRLHGKVINLYCTSMANTPEDVSWVQTTLTSWQESILAANSAMAAEMESIPVTTIGSPGPFSTILRTTIIGGVIGGILGLISFLFKRRRAD